MLHHTTSTLVHGKDALVHGGHALQHSASSLTTSMLQHVPSLHHMGGGAHRRGSGEDEEDKVDGMTRRGKINQYTFGVKLGMGAQAEVRMASVSNRLPPTRSSRQRRWWAAGSGALLQLRLGLQ